MIGTVLNNTYRLEKALTEGGMGQVFIASHLRIKGRKYAIKQLRPELAAAPNFQTRFQVEAEVMMELDHPHIVRIEDFLVQDNSYYLVMEFVEGHTLDGHLSLHGALATDEVHRLALELLSGLEYCHQKGVIHRDLKPSNLLLTQDDVLKLTDFGIALQENTDKRLTRTGTILGTPDYMSPEQIMSYPLDGRSDIYSAGIILYEMSAGLPPFLRSHDTGGSYQILFAHVHRPPPDLDQAKIPAYLREAIERSIKKDPSERFASAQQMFDFLQEARARDGFAPIANASNGVPNRPTPSLSASVFVPGQQPVEPRAIGSQDAISATSNDQIAASNEQLAASNEQLAAASLKETTPTPSNLDTSSLAKIAATPVTPRRRWPLFLSMAFLAGVSAMLAWWMIEPESFAQLQQWIEQKTGLKAPIPAYTRRIPNTREPVVLTPRRRTPERLTHTERRTPAARVPLLRTTPTHPRNDTDPRLIGTPGTPRRAVVVRRPTLRQVEPRVRNLPGVVVPWPFPTAHPQRRGATTSPHLRQPPTRRQPLVRRPVVPHTQRDLPPKKPKVDLPLWGYHPTQRNIPEARPLPTRPQPTRPLPIRPEPVRPEPIRPEPVRPEPLRPEPIRPRPVRLLPVKPRPDRPTPLHPEPVRPEPVRPDPVRPDPVRPEPVRPEPRRPEPTRPDPVRPDPVRPDPVRPEPARPEPVRPEPVRPDPVRPDPVRPDPVRPDPRRPDPVRPEPVRPEPVRPEPVRPEPIRRVPPRRQPVQRPLPMRRLPLLRKNPSGWPLAISSQCRRLLKMCVGSCLRQRSHATQIFRQHCRSECWRTRIVQYKQQKICPPDPPEPPRELAPDDAPTPPPTRRITL